MTRVRVVYNQLPVNPALHRIFLTAPSSAFCDPLRSSEPGTLPETTRALGDRPGTIAVVRGWPLRIG
jgi:hypothetical protein